MINVITPFGSSFRGLAAYLYHDVDRADTSERVAWTYTHNLATEDPEVAWRIMAATAMQQADLKREAGVVSTGRKSNAHVLHYVLSWHTEEHGEIGRDEMLQAALTSMTYMGTYEGERLGKGKHAKRTQHADEHQAVIVCHDEGPGKAPHVHIMMNRVHPEHGVMLPDSKDYEKLSAWALDYRRAQGKDHYCERRQKNAAKKAQGILTSDPRKPRNVYEQEQAIAEADPDSRLKAQLEAQQRRAKELSAKGQAARRQHAQSVRRLEKNHLDAERAERASSREAIRDRTARIRAAYGPKFDKLADRQAGELEAFNDARGTATGHVRNFMNAVKSKQWMTQIRTTRLRALSRVMKLAVSSGFQERDMLARHSFERRQLSGQQKAEERSAKRAIRDRQRQKLDALRDRYRTQHNDLNLGYDMDKAKLKAEWRELEKDRLATEIEDQRARQPKAAPGGGGGMGGTRSGKRSSLASAASGKRSPRENQSSDPTHDVPLDELRDIAREARKAEKDRDKRDQERGPERGD